ncbi:MAG: hypothetical protein WCQ47_06295 [bacterium]
MKKAILLLLILVLFASCKVSNPVDQSVTDLQVSQTIKQCLENENLVNDKCVPTNKVVEPLQLSKPHMKNLYPQLNPDGSHYWYYIYDAITAFNGASVDGVTIHVIYEKFSNGDCSDTFKAQILTCNDGEIYKDRVKVPVGNFCVKSISCLDGYTASEVALGTLNVTSGLVGDNLIF